MTIRIDSAELRERIRTAASAALWAYMSSAAPDLPAIDWSFDESASCGAQARGYVTDLDHADPAAVAE
ncbi:hypothetical protein ACIA5H_37005, partial [Nocardia sp. NPDC051900]